MEYQVLLRIAQNSEECNINFYKDMKSVNYGDLSSEDIAYYMECLHTGLKFLTDAEEQMNTIHALIKKTKK